MQHRSRRLQKANLSNRDAWPTEHLQRLLEAIDAELGAREEREPESFERGLQQALEQYRSSRAAQTVMAWDDNTQARYPAG